ncbi:MAG: hypothetical protein IJG13_04570, partial [Kiritimatiellae bacterium]|nr:hypothetical protein [Kiritimatiellia bacterium]
METCLKVRAWQCLAISLRWVGAVVLPLPAAFLFSMLFTRIGLWDVIRDCPEFVSTWFYRIINGVASSSVIVLCAYYLAPRAKFYAASIITTFYCTVQIVGITITIIRSGFDFWQITTYLTCPI